MAKAACGAHPDGEKDAAPSDSLTLFKKGHIVPPHLMHIISSKRAWSFEVSALRLGFLGIFHSENVSSIYQPSSM